MPPKVVRERGEIKCCVCGATDPDRFFESRKSMCKQCTANRTRELRHAKRDGVPNPPIGRGAIPPVFARQRIEMADDAPEEVESDDESLRDARLEEQIAALRQHLARLEDSTDGRFEATSDTIVIIGVRAERTDEKCEDLMEMIERNLPKIEEAIDMLAKRLDEDNKDRRIAELEEKVRMLTEEKGNIVSKLDALEKRLETLEGRKPSLLDELDTTNFSEYSEAFKAEHEGRFYSVTSIDRTLFGAIWRVTSMVIDEVENARAEDEFVWNSEMYERIYRMGHPAERENEEIGDETDEE